MKKIGMIAGLLLLCGTKAMAHVHIGFCLWPCVSFGVGPGLYFGDYYCCCRDYPAYSCRVPAAPTYAYTARVENYVPPAPAAAPVATPAPRPWVPSTPGAGHWVPEPNPYSYTPTPAPRPARVAVGQPIVTVTRTAEGIPVYTITH